MTRRKPAPEWRLGSLSPSKDGKNFVLPPQFFPEPTRVCNASSREPLKVAPAQAARPGADDHRKYRSRGW